MQGGGGGEGPVEASPARAGSAGRYCCQPNTHAEVFAQACVCVCGPGLAVWPATRTGLRCHAASSARARAAVVFPVRAGGREMHSSQSDTCPQARVCAGPVRPCGARWTESRADPWRAVREGVCRVGLQRAICLPKTSGQKRREECAPYTGRLARKHVPCAAEGAQVCVFARQSADCGCTEPCSYSCALQRERERERERSLLGNNVHDGGVQGAAQ